MHGSTQAEIAAPSTCDPLIRSAAQDGIRAPKNYDLREGFRFFRPLGDPGSKHEAIIDVLIPNYRSGPGSSRKVGEIESYQTPGLAELLRHDPVLVEVRVDFGAKGRRQTIIATTDELGALFSKVMAWEDRRQKGQADKDAFDIWRCLEICRRADVKPDTWPDGFGSRWIEILRSEFGRRDAAGCRMLTEYLGSSGVDPVQRVTRTMALVAAITGPQAGD